MPNLPQVSTNQATAETKGQSSNSTANRFDLLMGVSDDSIESKFSSLLSSMKTKLGSKLSGSGERKEVLTQTFDDMQSKADELQEEQDEEERKKKERLAAERHAQEVADDLHAANNKRLEANAQELQAASQELQDLHSMQVSTSSADGSSAAVRPSDILASAMARRSSGAAVTSTGAVSAASASSASTSTGTGQGSTDLGTDAAAGLTQGGYGTDAHSKSAQAARAMLNVEGVTTELNSGDLDALNQQTAATSLDKGAALDAESLDKGAALDADPVEDKLASSNTQELKQRLDVLARETHVSKLSLQMANPATLAAERRTAQQLAQLPTSNNQVASLTATTPTQQKVLSGAITQSGPTSSAEALTQGARNAIAANHGAEASSKVANHGAAPEDVQRVASLTNARVTEGKHTSAQELTRQALSQSGFKSSSAEVAAAKQAVVANHGASSMPNSEPGASQVNPELARPHGADDVKAQVQHNLARDVSHGVDLAQAADKGASVKAQAALLQLAEAQRSAGATEVNPNLETLVLEMQGNNLDLDAANNAMLAAIQSLKQGREVGSFAQSNAALSPTAAAMAAQAFGLGAAKASAQAEGRINPLTAGLYETYETSEFYAAMFGENSAEAVATLTGANVGKDEETEEASTEDATAVNAQPATPTAPEQPEVPVELSRFAFTGDAETDAQALHDRVMQMAARNLKQLSVELSPNSLGKMKISIALSDDNNAIAVSLQAANPHTRELLQQALPQLRDTLAKQNVATDVNVYDYTRDTTQTAQAVANAAAQQAKKPATKTAPANTTTASATTASATKPAAQTAQTAAAKTEAAKTEAAENSEFVHPATRYVLPDITVAQLSENAMRQRDKLKVATLEDEIAALDAKRAARGGAATDELLGSVSAKELEEIAQATLRDAGIDPSSAPELLAAMTPSAEPSEDKVGLGPEDFGIERTSLTPMPEIRVDLTGVTRSAEAALLAQSSVPERKAPPTKGTTTTAAALAHASAGNRLPRRLRHQAPANTLASSGIKRASDHPVPGMTLRARAADAELMSSTTNSRQGQAAVAQMSRLEALTAQLEAAAAKA